MDGHESRLWRHGRREVQFGGLTPTLLAWRVMSGLALLAFVLQMVAGMLQVVLRPQPAPVPPINVQDAPWRGDVPPAEPSSGDWPAGPRGR